MAKSTVTATEMHAVAGKSIEMPSGHFVANAAYTKEGVDLHVKSDGHEIVVKGYFSFDPHPDIVTHDGAHLSPALVDSFMPPEHAGQYAAADTGTLSDVSPDGRITEVVGTATVTHSDGTKVTASKGMAVSAGDVIETGKNGAVNIQFADNTTFAISESGRLAVNEYAYNVAEHSGHTFFSILQGIFVYTSGMIGHNNHNNVHIETPVGSIGVRGTIVAGEIHPAGQESKITIVQGAIVVTNGGGTITLNNNLHTAGFSSYQSSPTDMGTLDTHAFATYYNAVQAVTPETFVHVNDGTYVAHDAAQRAADKAAGHESITQPGPNDSAQPGHDTTQPNSHDATQPHTELSPTLQPVIATPPAPASETSFVTATSTTFQPPSETSTASANTAVTSAVSSAIVSTVASTAAANIPAQPSASLTAPQVPAGTTTTTTAPPVISQPTPLLHFVFGQDYTKSTATTADDGIAPFANNGHTTPLEIGRAALTNYAGTVHYELAYSDNLHAGQTIYTASGNVTGYTYQPATGSSTNLLNDPLFSFDSSTGAISLNDVGMHLIAGTPDFTLTAKDANGNVIASDHFVFQTGDFTSSNTLFGTTGNDITTNTGLGTGGINLSASGADIFTFDGNDRVNVIGSQSNFINLGAGNDMIVLNSFLPDNEIDGGLGNDRVIFNAPGATFDFTAPGQAPALHNIETIELAGGGGTVSAGLKLGIADIFDMTDANHFLSIKVNDATLNEVAKVQLDITGFTILAGTEVNDTAGTNATGSGTVTYQGTYQGSTVTLVIDQGNTAGGVIIAHA